LVDPAAQGDEVQQHVGVSDQASYGEQSSLEQQGAPEDRVIAQRLEPEEPGQDVDAERQYGQDRNTEPEQWAREGLDQTLHDEPAGRRASVDEPSRSSWQPYRRICRNAAAPY
jgi:hypothetical protein